MNKVSAMVLALVGCFASSASAMDPDIIILGDNEKVGEVLVLTTAKKVTLTAEQKSIQGLIKLSQESNSPVVYYDDASGGTLGFIGSSHIAFVTNQKVETLLATSEKEYELVFRNAKPIPYAEFLAKHEKNPPIPYPTVPLELAPSIAALLLQDRPSNLVICKSPDQLFVIEIIGVADKNSSIQITIHRKQ